jgi:hypothetical protein
MDFARQFLVTASVNKKWPHRLIEALTEVVFSAAHLRKKFPKCLAKDFFCSSDISKLQTYTTLKLNNHNAMFDHAYQVNIYTLG